MKFFIIFVFLTFYALSFSSNNYDALAFGLTISLAFLILLKSNESFMFREWTLLLYAINYLLSPAITYELSSEKVAYAMKITSDAYFPIAFFGFFTFFLGLFCIPSKIFKPNFDEISKVTVVNERFLFQLTLFGIFCQFASGVFSSDFAFFIYLLSLLRFVGVFALFAFNEKRYRYLVLFVLGFELYDGFKRAMFHDAIMWLIFFALYYVYLKKPNLSVKLIAVSIMILFILLIQAFKTEYRQRVWYGGEMSSIETITEVGLGNANSENLTGDDNLLGTLNRGNQAWIFASTVDNMDRTKDFQGLSNVNLYLESALLPRFLAPNKLQSGDRYFINRFSGHQISQGTVMGLGIFADGYVAYGTWGVYLFTFVLGLIFSLTFRLIQGWSLISPFYILFILPILNYAVRPDCELQTIINHLVKSVLLYGALVYLTKYRFTLERSSNV